MTQRGRPPKPLEQKKKLGNPGKRALPAPSTLQQLEPATDVPEPPRPLLQPGLGLWQRVWQVGPGWISPDTDLELLLMTCEMVDERWNLRIKAMNTADMAMGRRVDRLSGLIVANLSLLGFTPTDRSRLGVAEIKVKSKMQEMLERNDTV